MAIKDLQQRLVKEEANSGEALLKKLKKELEAVYVDARGWRKHIGFSTGGTAGQWDVYDSYWEEAYKEILSESKDAVKASKSAKAKQVLGDLQSLVKDIAGTEGITAPIGAAVQKMISVVQPYIEDRVKALKKGEGILTTMKKNAIASASSAVEGFVSATLSPLPFGAGDAIIGKAKGMLGGNKERRSTKAMDFISRVNENLEEEGGMVSSGSSAKKSGGVVSSSGGSSSGGGESSGGETSFSFLENIDKNVQFIADNMEDAESRRERLRKQGVKVAGGKVAGAGSLGAAGADGAGGDDGSWLSGLIAGGGGLSGLLGLKALIGKNIFGKSGFFRNLKALLLKSARTVFGKTGGKLMTGLLKGIGFAGKLAGIAAVVIAPIIDGILGYFNAEDWGVSKLGGIIGGIMGGGEGGALNALFNGMKWAAIGATAGSLIFPGIGTIIGGIGGALIGAILGWIGGDKIAKAVDGIGKWFEEKWNGFLNIFGLGKKESKETKLKKVQEDKKEIDTELSALEAKKKKQGGKLRGGDVFRHRQLTAMSENKAQRERNLEATGFDLTDEQKTQRIKELSYTLDESTGLGSGFRFGVAEAEDELKDAEETYKIRLERLNKNTYMNDEHKARRKEMLDKGIAKERAKVQAMKDELSALQGAAKRHSGGPIYESGNYNLTAGEMVMDNAAVRSMTLGSTLNQQMLSRAGMGGAGAGAGSSGMGETVLDNSQTTNIVQNIIPISTRGQMLPGETNSIRPVA